MASKKTTKKKPAKKKANPLQRYLAQRRKEAEQYKKRQPGSVGKLAPRLGLMLSVFWGNKKAFGLATAIYGLLYFIFVRVLTNVDFDSLQDGVLIAFGTGEENIITQIATVGSVFGESANLDNQSGLMYAVITFVCSMAFIWILRRIHAKQKVSVKEAFYLGMYPLVPFTLLMIWMIINFLPFTISAFFFQTALNNSLTITFAERLFFVSLFATGAVVSAYFAIGTLMASYAVTIPGATPTEARKSAKGLLRGRRLNVLRQAVLFLLLTGAAILFIMLLFVWLWSDAVIVMAAIMIVLIIPWFHLYFYHVYLELLSE